MSHRKILGSLLLISFIIQSVIFALYFPLLSYRATSVGRELNLDTHTVLCHFNDHLIPDDNYVRIVVISIVLALAFVGKFYFSSNQADSMNKQIFKYICFLLLNAVFFIIVFSFFYNMYVCGFFENFMSLS